MNMWSSDQDRFNNFSFLRPLEVASENLITTDPVVLERSCFK